MPGLPKNLGAECLHSKAARIIKKGGASGTMCVCVCLCLSACLSVSVSACLPVCVFRCMGFCDRSKLSIVKENTLYF